MSLPTRHERFLHLVMLVIDHQATDTQRQELTELIAQYPGLEAEYTRIRQSYHFRSPVSSVPDADTAFARHMQKLAGHIPQSVAIHEKTKRKPWRIAAWAAATTAAACTLWLFALSGRVTSRRNNTTAHTVTATAGTKKYITLPDGTKVWLNADSKLTYSAGPQEGNRNVWLNGEAFFDVKKDAARPMIIHTSTMDITVLGTSFNVRNYGNEKTAETVLVSGAVEVSLKVSPESKIRLKPNNKLVVVSNNATLCRNSGTQPLYWISQINTGKSNMDSLALQWKSPGLSFQQENLESAASLLEHWYNVHIVIADEQLKWGTYTGDFKNETLQEALEALRLTGDFRYTIQNDTVTIYKR